MRTILATLLILLLLFPVSAIGEIQTITHTVKQAFGGSQSPDDARIAAIAKAKREALEMAGVYVEALTIVKNAKVDKDEILALTAGVLQAQVISQKNYASEDAFGIDVVVKVVVDTSVLESRVKKLLQDRTHLEQLNQARKREKELLQQIAILEKENRKPTAKKQSSSKLKKQFQVASKGLTAVEWFYKAWSLLSDKKYTDPIKAIEYLNEAIRLQPDYAWAYFGRGAAYDEIGQYNRAIQDYSKVIRLKPDFVWHYYTFRGAAYHQMRKYKFAIQDFNSAIRLKPDYALAYLSRGVSYSLLGQHKLAIEDFSQCIKLNHDDSTAYLYRGISYSALGNGQQATNDIRIAASLGEKLAQDILASNGWTAQELFYKARSLRSDEKYTDPIKAIEYLNEAIRLQPDYALAYFERGMLYASIGQHKLAIDDFSQCIRLKPYDALAPMAYMKRGMVYARLGQHKLAIDDFSQYIRLEPDNSIIYALRGYSYYSLGNRQEAINDIKIAARLGDKGSQDFLTEKGIVW